MVDTERRWRCRAARTLTQAAAVALDAFVSIEPSGRVMLVTPTVEMGQGIFTAIAMAVAEELEVDVRQIVNVQAPPNEKVYGSPIFGLQFTGGSASTRAFCAQMLRRG